MLAADRFRSETIGENAKATEAHGGTNASGTRCNSNGAFSRGTVARGTAISAGKEGNQ